MPLRNTGAYTLLRSQRNDRNVGKSLQVPLEVQNLCMESVRARANERAGLDGMVISAQRPQDVEFGVPWPRHLV
jgi:hypothetical protein